MYPTHLQELSDRGYVSSSIIIRELAVSIFPNIVILFRDCVRCLYHHIPLYIYPRKAVFLLIFTVKVQTMMLANSCTHNAPRIIVASWHITAHPFYHCAGLFDRNGHIKRLSDIFCLVYVSVETYGHSIYRIEEKSFSIRIIDILNYHKLVQCIRSAGTSST